MEMFNHTTAVQPKWIFLIGHFVVVNKPDEIEKENRYVRMPVGKGKWTVTSRSDNEISILFQYFADPGGNIPAWLVNSFVVKNPHLMLQSIRGQMAD